MRSITCMSQAVILSRGCKRSRQQKAQRLGESGSSGSCQYTHVGTVVPTPLISKGAEERRHSCGKLGDYMLCPWAPKRASGFFIHTIKVRIAGDYSCQIWQTYRIRWYAGKLEGKVMAHELCQQARSVVYLFVIVLLILPPAADKTWQNPRPLHYTPGRIWQVGDTPGPL